MPEARNKDVTMTKIDDNIITADVSRKCKIAIMSKKGKKEGDIKQHEKVVRRLESTRVRVKEIEQ